MFKRWLVLLFCLAAVISFSACGDKQPVENRISTAETGKIRVFVTFNALMEFTKAVGGDMVEISTVIPDGTEPHDFEPKAQDLVGLSTARIFVYNGLGMEAWVDEAVNAAANQNLILVEASNGADLISNSEEEAIEEHGQYDPHTWLSLKGAETEVKNICDALVRADPGNQDYYEKNCSEYISRLETLYYDYDQKFQSVEKKSFVTGHAAFAYLCRDFGLNQNSVEDVLRKENQAPSN